MATMGLRSRLVAAALLLPVAAGKDVLKGVSYGPVPLKGQGRMPNDDFMVLAAKPLWGQPRGDLEVLQMLGANAVRLYGNDPQQDHGAFLDEAKKQGLQVIPGMSDYPYIQMPGNCLTTNFNCYQQVKEQYSLLLQNGFQSVNGTYHPALKYFIVINEPDLKIPIVYSPQHFCKVAMSAIDAMVDAEKELNVTQNLITFTVTFSFGQCGNCRSGTRGQRPGLGQMLELRYAMQNPREYGYMPRNDLAAIYKDRFVNSFNTANPATDLKRLFLDDYHIDFPGKPVFIGEFHGPNAPVPTDVQNILTLAENSQELLGISFFEFQVRYDKGGTEMGFGMFGLGNTTLGQMTLYGETFDIWCLAPVIDPLSKVSVAVAVTGAYGGQGVDLDTLCLADPAKVNMTDAGFAQIQAQKDAARMGTFIQRIVNHMGGAVVDKDGLLAFAQRFSDPALPVTFASMVGEIGGHPNWATWDSTAACVADRSADEGWVGQKIGDACGFLAQSQLFDCQNIPQSCMGDTFRVADYVFSVYFAQAAQSASPLQNCYFDTAAIFAPASVYRALDTGCVVTNDPATTPLTEEGYKRILGEGQVDVMAELIQRVVDDQKVRVGDEEGLLNTARAPPATLQQLRDLIAKAAWTCGGDTGRNCDKPAPVPSSPGGGSPWWLWVVVLGASAVAIAGILAATQRCKLQQGQQRNVNVPLVESLNQQPRGAV